MQSETSGDPLTLAPGLIRILAPNPSPMTYTGTNTYLLGETDLAVIDPGPDLPEHLEAVLSTAGQAQRIKAILVTHSHLDHAPLARPLAEATGAPIYAAGPSDWGRSPVMQRLAHQIGGGEGVDHKFIPDILAREGHVVSGAWGDIDVLETPGHMANHLSFAWRGMLFCGDLVMGWSTSLVSPPDGDMTAFMASCARLADRQDSIYHPGHGPPVTDPQARAQALITHRQGREAQILAQLGDGGWMTAQDLARAIYTDVAPSLLPAATRNVLAHLIDLEGRNRILCNGEITATSAFQLHQNTA